MCKRDVSGPVFGLIMLSQPANARLNTFIFHMTEHMTYELVLFYSAGECKRAKLVNSNV